MDLLIASSHGDLPTLSLTANSSWLPWRRVAMPLRQPSDASTLIIFVSVLCLLNVITLHHNGQVMASVFAR